MISLNSTVPLIAAIRRLTLVALIMPAVGIAQQTLETLSIREQSLLDEIDREMSLNGPYSGELIGLLTDLSFVYQEIGAYVREEETILRVQTIIRANNGLNSLDQVPIIRRLMNREKERRNATAAWYLEQDLLDLANRNPDDVRSAGILAEAGDNRLDILRRYDEGEFPPELMLGCFYDDSGEMEEARLRGSQPMATVRVSPNGRNCGAGDRTFARRAINASAQWFYLQALGLLDRNGAQASTEVPELLMKLVRSSYLFTNPDLGTQSLRNLLAYESRNSQDWLPRINARVLLADWDLLYARDRGTKFEESALATYQGAYELAVENDVPEESIAEIFYPDVPVMLPSFIANPLVSEETPRSKGYIEITFVVTDVGKSDAIEVLDQSEKIPRSAVKDLVRTIKFGRFRPQLTDGRFVDTTPFVVRYFVND